VLIDTSTDLRAQVLRHGIRRIDAVFYTHAHADHVLGLDELRLFNWRQGGAIPIYGSPRTLEAIARTFWYVFDPGDSEQTRPILAPCPIAAPFAFGGCAVVPVPLWHGSLPILGYRLGRFAYLTDVSRFPPSSYALVEGLDLLVLSALRHRSHPTHLTLSEAVEQARRIGARRTLFTHVSHEIDHADVSARLPAGVELAYDGLTVEVAP
jgi:phosphoribosyl 1,2-cyclic phosphate phosphodiesterase